MILKVPRNLVAFWLILICIEIYITYLMWYKFVSYIYILMCYCCPIYMLLLLLLLRFFGHQSWMTILAIFVISFGIYIFFFFSSFSFFFCFFAALFFNNLHSSWNIRHETSAFCSNAILPWSLRHQQEAITIPLT